MILAIPNVIPAAELADAQQSLATAQWTSGAATAGHLAGRVKQNLQLPASDVIARSLGAMVVNSLKQHPLFVSAALPLHFLPPMFNSYAGGEHYGTHVDGAIRHIPEMNRTIRTDLSCTVFFTEPDDYDGGELVIEDTYGTHPVKLPAGHCVLYPATSLHQVTPVTRGRRIGAFFWLQSLIRDDQRRSLMFDLDCSIRQLDAHHPAVVNLTGIYHNLLRQWAET